MTKKSTFTWADVTKAAVNIVTFGAAIPMRKAAIRNTVTKTQPMIREFKRQAEPGFFVPESQENKVAVELLVQISTESDDLRETAFKKAQEMKLPEKGKVQTLAESEKEIEDIGRNLNEVIEKIRSQKAIRSVVEHSVIHWAKDHLKKDIIMNAAAALPSIAIATDIGGITGGEGALGDIIPGDMLDATDILTGIATFPDALSNIKTVSKEIDMLSKGETTWEEAFKNGFLPAAADTALTVGTLMIDFTFFAGIPVTTVLKKLLGLEVKKISPQESIKSDFEILKPYYRQINDRHSESVKTINASIAESFKDMPATIQQVPAFSTHPQTVDFTRKLIQANYRDTAVVTNNIKTMRDAAIEKVPKRNWKDKILTIDRPAIITKMYQDAGTEMTTIARTRAKHFDQIVSTDLSHINVVLVGVLQDGQAKSVLDKLPEKLPAMATGYNKSLEDWKNKCTEIYMTGTANIAEVSKKEAEDVSKLKSDLKPAMKPAYDRICANLTRLGVDRKYAPCI